METGAPVKDAQISTSFDDLPPETVVEILTRLPVKTLVRSTSVNKSWYSLIINPNFIAAHIRRLNACSDQNALLIFPRKLSPPYNPCALLSAEKCSVIEKFELPFSTKSGTVKIIGSVNGLACLTDVSPVHVCRDLYLWNPSVRRYKSLLSSCFKEVVGDWRQRYCVVGLGYHEPSDDFRVVRMVYRYDYGCSHNHNQLEKVPPKVEIFSLKRNTWRKLKNPVLLRIPKQGGVFVQGSVYWLEAKVPEEYFEEMWIISFDFCTEVFGEIKLPEKVRYCLGAKADFVLMKLAGSVAVCVFDINVSNDFNEVSTPCCIWVMRHKDGVVSWARHFKVVVNFMGWPLKITKSGTLVLESSNFGLVACNLRNMLYKDLGFRGPTDPDDFFSESILPLRFGGPCNLDTSFRESLVLLDRGYAPLGQVK